jgi:hypothetical protein
VGWISVHDKVLGPKLRHLAKRIGCSRNEALGLLSSFWLWCAVNADDDGRLKGVEEEDVIDVIASGCSEELDPKDVFDALVEKEWIDKEGHELIAHDWPDWQSDRIRLMGIREYDAGRKRISREKSRLARENMSTSAASPPVNAQTAEPDQPQSGDAPTDKEAKPKKVKYGDFVTMTEDEFQKLLDQYGNDATAAAIEALDNYKGANGKRYKSDYRAILTWTIDKIRKERPELFRRKQAKSPVGAQEGNPYSEFMEVPHA